MIRQTKRKDNAFSSTPSPIASRVALESHEGKSTVMDPPLDVARRSFHIVLNYDSKGNENVMLD